MAEKFLMPKLSPTMEEGQISRWVKNEGEAYEANETLAEVDTDKATMEMTALKGGTVLKILKGAGETALLGETIAIVGQKGEDITALLAEVSSNGSAKAPAKEEPKTDEPKAEEPKAEAPQAKSVPPAVAGGSPQPIVSAKQESSESNGRMIVSPIAARMAADNGIDLRSVSGSGPNGRIIKRDIEDALAGDGTKAPRGSRRDARGAATRHRCAARSSSSRRWRRSASTCSRRSSRSSTRGR
jgi:pyruvate dehydrogenase E2 component (dihydrolipoamide acetyltransferase)